MGALLIAALSAGLWIDEKLGPHVPAGIPPYPCWLVIALVVVIGCCRELRQLMRHRGIRTSRWVTYGGVVAITLANWFPWLRSNTPQTIDHLTCVLATACSVNMIVLLREGWVFRESGSAVITAGASMLLIFYLGLQSMHPFTLVMNDQR
jgi:hypothetical protein